VLHGGLLLSAARQGLAEVSPSAAKLVATTLAEQDRLTANCQAKEKTEEREEEAEGEEEEREEEAEDDE
jgi:hypothetical protein